MLMEDLLREGGWVFVKKRFGLDVYRARRPSADGVYLTVSVPPRVEDVTSESDMEDVLSFLRDYNRAAEWLLIL